MYLQKDKVETLSAKEVLTCGFHRMPPNQLCSKNYTLFGPAILKPKKNHSDLLRRPFGSPHNIRIIYTFSRISFFYLSNEYQSMILAFFF